MMNRLLLQSVALAATVATGGVANAALTAYTSQTTFSSAVASAGVDTFAGFSTTAFTAGPITRSAGSFTYSAVVLTTTFFGAGPSTEPTSPWLSTNTATDSITFSGFSGGASAIGGNFFGSNIAGAFAAGNVTLTATDSLGASLTQTITGATIASFLGFTSTGTISTLVLSAVQPALPDALWPTADNLTIAVVAVPEPETYALLLAGLGVVGFAARRRRHG